MDIITVDENSKWLKLVQDLGDSARETVGFMPEQAFKDYAKRGHILALIEEKELAAYVMFRYKNTAIIIVHLCVSPKHRKRGYAKTLIEALYEQEKHYTSYMQLSCRRDYGIEHFWHSLGFAPIAEKAGRATTHDTILTTWIRNNPEYPCLFSTTTDFESEKAQVVLDTNIVIDLCDGTTSETAPLLQTYLNDYIAFYVSKDIFDEINQKDDKDIRNKHREFAKNHFAIIETYDATLYGIVLHELLDLKPAKEFSNTWYDLSHIAYTIAFGAEIFITRDKGWLNSFISDLIFDRHGLGQHRTENNSVARIMDMVK